MRPAKDELVVLIESAPTSIDPRFAVSAYDFKLSRLLFAPLVSVDNENTEPKMELAESVVPEDGNVWRITLRDAKFSDGKPLTSDDVVYTFDSIRDPKTGSRLRQRFVDDGLERIEVVDARTLRFHLSHVHAPFITDLDVGILRRDHPEVGAGAFVLEGRTSDAWNFLANPHYFGGAPKVRALRFRVIRDDNSRLLALVGGSGDLTQNTVTPLLLPAIEAQGKLTVTTARSAVFSYLGINCDDPILKDVRVRRAIAHAIDRPQIVRTKLHDKAVLATGMLPTFHWAYRADVSRYDFDVARAKQLLDEAGHPDPDGDGPLPRFTLLYKTSSNRFRVAVAQVIAQMLSEVGIEVEVRPYEFATFFADVKKGNFQLFSMQIPEISEPDLYSVFFGSGRIPTRDNLDAGANRARYRSAEVDRLLETGRRTIDRAERARIYGEVQRVLAIDLPVVPLWHDDNIVVTRRGVSGYQLLPTGQMTSLARAWKQE